MLKETVKLETLRQKIEKIENEAGSTSDFIDRGRPNESQLKTAQELIARKSKEAENLKVELHELIGKSPKEAVEEWVNWHKNILQMILLESETDIKSKTRLSIARGTLNQWDKVLQKEQDYVGINWYYLKSYKARVEQEIKKDWWKFWR